MDRCLAALDGNPEPHDILIIDDGSRTPVRQYLAPASNRVLVTLHENQGLAAALNFAARFCLDQGYEFYVRQDADDLSHPDRLTRQRAIADETSAALVASRARVVDENGKLLWMSPPAAPWENARSILRYSNPFFHSSWMLRAEMFRKIGFYSEDFPGAEDYEFLLRLVRIGKIVTSSEALIDYTIHSSSILSSSRTPGISVMRARFRYLDWYSLGGWYGLLRGAAAVAAPRSWKVRGRAWMAERSPIG
jgi:GT2 family glycosyltransferase